MKIEGKKLPKRLPIFEGYFVDIRLKQFRTVRNLCIEFINFNSNKGEEILSRYIKSLNPQSEEFKDLIDSL